MIPPGRRLYKHAHAKEDLVEIYAYLLERNERAARGFLTEVRKAFELILAVPTVGQEWPSSHAKLKGLRYTTVSRRFRNYVIFYRAVEDGVQIVTVLHAARDAAPLVDVIEPSEPRN